MNYKAKMNCGRLLLTACAGGLIALGAQADFANKIGKSVAGYGETRSTLADFPVLVRITSEQAQGCRDDGADLQFTSLDGKTVYPHEIDVWNPQGESTVWVRLPEMKNGTLFVMHWGDADYEGASFEKGAVWKGAGYAAVWHMSEESGTVANATEHGTMMDAVPAGARAAYSQRTTVTAPIGYARDTGAEDVNDDVKGRAFLKVSNYDSLALGDTFTLSSWIRIKDYHGNYDNTHRTRNARFFVRKNDWKEDKGYILSLANAITATNFRGGGNGAGHTPKIPDAKDKWVHFAWVFNGTKITSYANGNNLGSATIGKAEDNGLDMGMGSHANANDKGEYANDSYLVGMFDEARLQDLQSGVNYDDWFAAEYAMGNDKAFLNEFEVSSDDGDVVISLRAPKMIYENDFEALELIVSRPPDRVAGYQEVELVYTGDANLIADFPTKVIFGAGRETVSVPLKAIDNAEKSGDRSFTVSIAEGEGYVASETTGSVTVTVVDDESLTAGVCTWTGAAGDKKWNTPGNWEFDRVPTIVDTALFGASGIADNDTILVDGAAIIKELKYETTTPFTLAADQAGGVLRLGAITRVDVEGNEGNHTLAVPTFLYAGSETNCVWYIAGAGALVVKTDFTKSAGTYVYKTGTGTVEMQQANVTFGGPWIVKAGLIALKVGHSIKGNLYIGGDEATASVRMDTVNGAGYDTVPHVYANGYFGGNQKTESGRVTTLDLYAGGAARIGDYSFVYYVNFHGGTLQDGGSSYNARDINCYASDEMATTGIYWRFDSSRSISVERGSRPVDLLIRGGLAEGGDNDKTITKKWPGVVKSIVNFNNLKPHFRIDAGTWYVDNPGDYGLGLQETTVAAGATIGGTGCVGMKDAKNTNTLALNAGTETNYATLVAGTIDTETGDHIYGTFTSGRSAAHNHLGLGAWAHVKAGIGAPVRDEETGKSACPNDKLMVYGPLDIGANCVLDLASNSTTELKSVKSGVYTIVEADQINGKFASVILPEGAKWRVNYVAEAPAEEGAEAVVTKITVTVSNGLAISIR